MRSVKLPVVTDVKSVRGKRVLVRSSLNVPLENGEVANYFRIMRAMPTLMHLTHAGAKVVLLTHIGRDPKITLEPLYRVLKNHLDIAYESSIIGSNAEDAVAKLKEGQVLLLENLRSHDEEVENDDDFAKRLASYGELYVNDAFAVSHREHASIVGIPRYVPGCFGLTFCEEYVQLRKTIRPHHPALFILGGAKFETKYLLIEKYIRSYDHVFIGGALANNFFKARGHEVGDSFVSDMTIADDLLKHKKILLPVDVTVDGGNGIRVIPPDKVEKGEKILDAGPETVAMLEKYIMDAETILWNGPLGNYESGFVDITKECAKLIAKSNAYSVVGGGNTIASIESLAINDKFSFISIAGGAMLTFLKDGTLPGIQAILDAKHG